MFTISYIIYPNHANARCRVLSKNYEEFEDETENNLKEKEKGVHVSNVVFLWVQGRKSWLYVERRVD